MLCITNKNTLFVDISKKEACCDLAQYFIDLEQPKFLKHLLTKLKYQFQNTG